MAKFRQGNLQLKTNKEILLGDSQEISIKYDGSNTSIGDTSDTYLTLHQSNNTFESYNNSIQGLYISSVTQRIGVNGDTYLAAFQTGDRIQMYTGGVLASQFDQGTASLYHNGVEVLQTDTTGVIVLGDIHCDDLYTSGNTIYVGAGMIKSDSGNVELYYGSVKTLETRTGGIYIHDSIGNRMDLGFSASNMIIRHNTGSAIEFKTVGNDTAVRFEKSNAEYMFYSQDTVSNVMNISAKNTESKIISEGDGLNLTITATNSSSVAQDALVIDPDAGVELYHQGNKVFETDSTGVIVTGTLTTDNVEVLGSINLPTGTLSADDVGYAELSGSTYNTLQEAMNVIGGAGLISGGVITDDGTAAVNVTQGTGMLRAVDDYSATLYFMDFPAANSIAIPVDETKDIVVSYNVGSPIVQAVDPESVDSNTNFLLGQVGRAGEELFISNIRQRISRFSSRILARLYGTNAVERDGGEGLILGESGDTNRYVTMTAGEVWAILDKESIPAFNSGTGDVFTTIYEDGVGGWVETSGETQWNNYYWDDGTGILNALTNNNFGVNWFWYVPSSSDMVMVYGRGNHKSLAEADSEPVPDGLPSIISEYGMLLGKIIFLRDALIADEVSSAFDVVYNFSAATDHGNLSNLTQPSDHHTQYAHIDGRRDFTGTVGGLDPVSDTDFSTKNYVDSRTPGFDGTTQLYLDFTTGESPPAHKEGRLFWDSTCHTIAQYNDEADITQQLGQEFLVRFYNATGETIPNGGVLSNAGSTGIIPQVQFAKADSDATMAVVSVATHEVEPGTIGYATFTGFVRGLDLSAYTNGSYLYVSDSTAGTFTDVRPKWPNIAHAIGMVVNNDSVNGTMYVDSRRVQENIHIMTYSLPLEGVTDSQVPLLGTYTEVGTGATGDVATDWSVSNQHAYLTVNSLDGTGLVTITGTTVDELTSVPTSSDTETILVDETGSYQTVKKWWEITNIDIPATITTINYDYGVLGYPDFGNKNFRLAGYRVDAMASGNNASFTIRIEKVQDDGDGKLSIVEIESIGVDSGSGTDQIIDNLRTGADDRSYDPAVSEVWEDNRTFTFKQFDLNTYFTNGENTFLGASKDEGILVIIEGAPLATGIFNVDWLILHLTIEILPT